MSDTELTGVEPTRASEPELITKRPNRIRSAITSLGVIVGVGLAASLLSFLRTTAELRIAPEDAAAAIDQMRVLNDDPDHPHNPKPVAGPFSQTVAAFVADVMPERQAFALDARRTGYRQIATLDDLAPTSPLLSECTNFDSLASEAQDIAARWPAHIAKARDSGVSAGLPEPQIADFQTGLEHSAYADQWRLDGELATDMAKMCRLLASSKWQNHGGAFTFADPKDASRFSAIMRDMQRIDSEKQSRESKRVAQLGRLR